MTDREDVVLKIPLAEAQEKLSTQIGQAREMLMRSPQNEQQLRTRDAEYRVWRDYTRELLNQMFSTSQIAREFTGVGGMSLGRPRTLSGRIQDLHFDIQSRLDRLLSIHSRLELFHTEISEQQLLPPGPLEHLERIISRFHTVARQLRSRYNDRPTLDVTDEYDVQNLLHALLRLFFDDIRPEEWTPSYAGGASRMDFLLRNEQVVVETKKTRPRLRAKEVADQLIIDIRRYKEHPHCHTLVCFVYDPDELIANPDGLEGDLSQPSDGLSVRVFVRPKRR